MARSKSQYHTAGEILKAGEILTAVHLGCFYGGLGVIMFWVLDLSTARAM